MLQAFAERVWTHAGWLLTLGGLEVTAGTALALAAVVVALLIFLLPDDRSYRQLLGYALRPASLYLRLMGWAQGRLDDFFGGLLSWRAFDRCLLIAFLYPVFLLLLAWHWEGR